MDRRAQLLPIVLQIYVSMKLAVNAIILQDTTVLEWLVKLTQSALTITV